MVMHFGDFCFLDSLYCLRASRSYITYCHSEVVLFRDFVQGFPERANFWLRVSTDMGTSLFPAFVFQFIWSPIAHFDAISSSACSSLLQVVRYL